MLSRKVLSLTKPKGMNRNPEEDISIQPTDGTLTDTITSGHSRPGSNCNKGILHIFKAPG